VRFYLCHLEMNTCAISNDVLEPGEEVIDYGLLFDSYTTHKFYKVVVYTTLGIINLKINGGNQNELVISSRLSNMEERLPYFTPSALYNVHREYMITENDPFKYHYMISDSRFKGYFFIQNKVKNIENIKGF
jgi:hypothetical protein